MAAGLILACAAPAHADITFRAEGEAATLVPETPVTAPAVTKDGTNRCEEGRVIGALETGTQGQWTGRWFSFGDYSVDSIKGEEYTFSDPQGRFWAMVVNNREVFTGPCGTPVQDGDEVVYFISRCEFDGTACSNEPVRPLGLLDVPASANKGQPFTVRVVRYDANGRPAPAEGATVAGGGVSATTDTEGRATLALPGTGSIALKASKPGSVRTADEVVCVHDGDDGTCGTQKPGGGTDPTGPQLPPRPAYRAPDPEILGIPRRVRFDADEAPRELRGRVNLGTRGLLAVKLRLTRRGIGGRQEYFSGRTETWRPLKDGKAFFFRVGDRAEWSYLLPEPLTRGRYLLEVAVSDQTHQRRVEAVVFFVR